MVAEVEDLGRALLLSWEGYGSEERKVGKAAVPAADAEGEGGMFVIVALVSSVYADIAAPSRWTLNRAPSLDWVLLELASRDT